MHIPIRRHWAVVRTHDGEVQEIERHWTKGGAERARHYFWVLQKAVGYRAQLDVFYR